MPFNRLMKPGTGPLGFAELPNKASSRSALLIFGEIPGGNRKGSRPEGVGVRRDVGRTKRPTYKMFTHPKKTVLG